MNTIVRTSATARIWAARRCVRWLCFARSHTVIAVIRSSQSFGGRSSGAIDVSRRDRETSRSPPERLLSGTPANNDNRKEKVCRRHGNPRPLLKLARRDMTCGRGTKLLQCWQSIISTISPNTCESPLARINSRGQSTFLFGWGCLATLGS